MSKENPSLTMVREVVALGRTQFVRPHTPEGDDKAQLALTAGMHPTAGGEPVQISWTYDLLAPRAPYFDRLVLASIASGVRQIVNLGAGYDDRSLRFPSAGVQFFEIDLPHVLEDKERRFAHMKADLGHVTLVPADFRTDDIDDILASAGHDATKPTLFIAEHVLLFLIPSHVQHLFKGLAASAAPRSILAVTAEMHPEGVDDEELLFKANELFEGEGPLRTILAPTTWADYLAAAGWDIATADRHVPVDHFKVTIDNLDVQVQTNFVTSTPAADRQTRSTAR